MATCPNGHENPEGQNFCGECGASLVARPADEPPTPSTGQPRGKPESREQRGDESELVKSPDHSSPKSHALAEAEAALEVAEAEAAAAAARARVARMKAMNTPASGSKPVAKQSKPVAKQFAPKPSQQRPPQRSGVETTTGGPAVKKRKVWPWLIGALLFILGSCTVLAMIGGGSKTFKPSLDKDGTYYQVNGDTRGTYETQGSNRSNGRACNWRRLQSSWNQKDDISDVAAAMIDRGDVQPGQTARVTLEPGDYFVFYGCYPWRYVG